MLPILMMHPLLKIKEDEEMEKKKAEEEKERKLKEELLGIENDEGGDKKDNEEGEKAAALKDNEEEEEGEGENIDENSVLEGEEDPNASKDSVVTSTITRDDDVKNALAKMDLIMKLEAKVQRIEEEKRRKE